MRCVFAMGGNPKAQFVYFQERIRSVLVSFHYKSLLEFCITLPHLDYLLLDSGAFSAWSKGITIDVHEYAAWLDYVKEKFRHVKRIEAINLDVITRKTDSPARLKAAYDESMRNLAFLKSRGHNVLPVHHQFEPWSILTDYAKDFPFVCISPNNLEGSTSKRRYLDGAFGLIKASVETHGLAVTVEEFVMRYPWFSVDSSIVAVPFRFGRTAFHSRRVAHTEVEGHNRNPEYLRRLAFETVKHLHQLEYNATQLWKKRGVEWTV